MHGGKSEGVTHESLCHHHLIPHQFEWEKSSEDEIEKERKEGEGKRKGRGKGKKERTSRFFFDRRCFDGRNSSDRETKFVYATTTMQRQLRVGAKDGGFHRRSKG